MSRAGEYTVKQEFESKYVNFQRFVDGLTWAKPRSEKYTASALPCKLFIAALQPYANAQNIDRLRQCTNCLQNPDFDQEDFKPLIDQLMGTVPMLHDMVEIDEANIVREEAEKLMRYIQLFLALLL